MLKTRKVLLGLLLTSILLVAACSPQSQTSSGQVADEGPMVEEQMLEDEMADEQMSGEMSDDEMMQESTTFVVRIENLSDDAGLTVLAPGAYELNDHPVSFFTVGEADRGQGLEALAEDGDPSGLVDAIKGHSINSGYPVRGKMCSTRPRLPKPFHRLLV